MSEISDFGVAEKPWYLTEPNFVTGPQHTPSNVDAWWLDSIEPTMPPLRPTPLSEAEQPELLRDVYRHGETVELFTMADQEHPGWDEHMRQLRDQGISPMVVATPYYLAVIHRPQGDTPPPFA